jgi:hypothetical protein
MFCRLTWISPLAGTPFIFARAATSTAGVPSPPAPNSRPLIEARCSRGVDCFSLQLAIIQNHLNGRDSHVRQMRVYSSRAHAAFDIESGALVTHAAPLLRALLFRRGLIVSPRPYCFAAQDCSSPTMLAAAACCGRVCLGQRLIINKIPSKAFTQSNKFTAAVLA